MQPPQSRRFEQPGAALSKTDPRQAVEAAQEFWLIFQQQAGNAGAIDLQIACIDAIGQLHNTSLEIPLMKLLDPNVADRVRGATLRALGDLGDPNAADTINQWLTQERDPANRLDAIGALGKTGSFGEVAQTLYSFFAPRTSEPDAAVREQAWEVFQSLLPSASKQLLAEWAQTLIGDPQRRVSVLLALNAKLLIDKDLEQRAYSQQTTGETYLKLGKPEDAAINFSSALDYWKQKKVESVVTEQLVQQLMNALLQSKQYAKACAFGAEAIGNNRAQQETVGSIIGGEADRLYTQGDANNDVGALKDSQALINESMKMKPPLDSRYRDHLDATLKSVQQRLASL